MTRQVIWLDWRLIYYFSYSLRFSNVVTVLHTLTTIAMSNDPWRGRKILEITTTKQGILIATISRFCHVVFIQRRNILLKNNNSSCPASRIILYSFLCHFILDYRYNEIHKCNVYCMWRVVFLKTITEETNDLIVLTTRWRGANYLCWRSTI